MRAIRFLILFLLVVLCATGTVVTFNTPAAGGHGFYNGSGGVDGGFTTAADVNISGDGIASSLRLSQRFVGPIMPNGNDYTCVALMQCNIDWSINTFGNRSLSDYSYSLFIQDVTNGGASLTFDPTSPILGGSYWDPVNGKVMTWNPNVVGNQNSEYLGFSFISAPLGGWNPTDYVVIQLTTVDSRTLVSFTNVITVNSPYAGETTPEPATLAVVPAGLILLFLWKRRRRG